MAQEPISYYQFKVVSDRYSIYDTMAIALRLVQEFGWNVISVNPAGIIAAASGEVDHLVEIIPRPDGFQIVSRSAGEDKVEVNRDLVAKFVTSYNSRIENLDPIKLTEYKRDFETAVIKQKKYTGDGRFHQVKRAPELKLKDYLLPGKLYTVTPILMIINVAVFIAMVISGVDFLEPQGPDLVTWGSNYAPFTLNGEYWRIITCCFVHIGFFHLFMNMYGLLFIGMMLERIMGKERFLVAYLATGIIGSVSSLAWNPVVHSAGASGAVFGMYGLFVALLTSNIIEKTARRQLMTSMLMVVGFNLIYGGSNTGIDNAAHIGGLISGFVIGYIFLPGIKKPKDSKLKLLAIAVIIAVTLGGSVLALTNVSNEGLKREQSMKRFMDIQEEAMKAYEWHDKEVFDSLAYSQALDSSTAKWNEGRELINGFFGMKLNKAQRDYYSNIRDYCDLRIKTNELFRKVNLEGDTTVVKELDQLNLSINDLVGKLNKQ